MLDDALVAAIVAKLDRLEALVLWSCVLFTLEILCGLGLVPWLRSGGNTP